MDLERRTLSLSFGGPRTRRVSVYTSWKLQSRVKTLRKPDARQSLSAIDRPRNPPCVYASLILSQALSVHPLQTACL